MTEVNMREVIKGVKANLRVTKVVCTRSVKGKFGDSYAGFSAVWDTVQDDAGGGVDLISVQGEDNTLAVHGSGMTLKESRVAALILGMQADISAHDQAYAGGNLTQDHWEGTIKGIKRNYSRLIAQILGVDEEEVSE